MSLRPRDHTFLYKVTISHEHYKTWNSPTKTRYLIARTDAHAQKLIPDFFESNELYRVRDAEAIKICNLREMEKMLQDAKNVEKMKETIVTLEAEVATLKAKNAELVIDNETIKYKEQTAFIIPKKPWYSRFLGVENKVRGIYE